VVIVRGWGDDGASQDRVCIEDLNAERHELSLVQFNAARAAMPRHGGRLVRLTDEPQFVDIGGAIKRGIEACVTGLREGHGDLAGHAALRSWASYLVRPELFRARFVAPADVMDALLDLHRRVEGQGALLRALFADGVGEASALLRDPQLRKARLGWSRLARDWSKFAVQCAPAEPRFEELQHLAVQIDRAVGAGMDAELLAERRARFTELRGELALAWSPVGHDLATHLTAMGHTLLELVQREEEAVDELAEWAGMAERGW